MSDPKYKNIGEPEDRVIEELSEVVKECMSLMQELSKARRFGYFNFHPAEPDKLNIDRIKAEMNDCVEAFERLEVKMRDLSHKYWASKKAEEESKVPPTMGDKSTCVHCGHEIEYVGSYWRHVGMQPRHIAEPKK